MILVRSLIVVVCLAGLRATTMQVALWDDELAVWAHAVALAPKKPRPLVNLGTMQARRGDQMAAIESYTAAIALTQQPGRSEDERTVGYALATANLALAQEPPVVARETLGRLLAQPGPSIHAIQEMDAWLARVSSGS